METQTTPLDKAINQYIPLYFYHIYELEDGLHGYLIDWKPAWEAERDYNVTYHFNGREAQYWMGTDNYSILRQQALDFAVAIHEKRINHCRVDLSSVSGQRVSK